MRPETRNVLLRAYNKLQIIVDELYIAHDIAAANDYDEDASLLVSRADKLYEEAENLNLVITELEER